MICFLDRTFCSSPNCKGECGRQMTLELMKRAKEWWGNDSPPIAYSNYCDKSPSKEGKQRNWNEVIQDMNKERD